MARIVGIDFGEKRVGIAATDPLQIIANGITTLSPDEALKFLKKYVVENAVERFVIGRPKTLQNALAQVVHELEKWVARLRTECPNVAVEFVDERFTSVLAQRTMLSAGLKKQARQNKALVDQISATIILQSYLESRNFTKNNTL